MKICICKMVPFFDRSNKLSFHKETSRKKVFFSTLHNYSIADYITGIIHHMNLNLMPFYSSIDGDSDGTYMKDHMNIKWSILTVIKHTACFVRKIAAADSSLLIW